MHLGMTSVPAGPPRWRVRAAFDLVWTGGRSVGRAEAVRLEDALVACSAGRAPAVAFEDGLVVVSLLLDADDRRAAVAEALHAVACAARYVPCLAIGTVQQCTARPDPALLRSTR